MHRNLNGFLDHRGSPIVITGAGRGLGRSYALLLAASGAQVVVNDVDLHEADAVVEEIRRSGGVAVASGHSVADPAQCAALIELCVSQFGRIDGLVNNAGVNYSAAIAEEDPERQRDLITVNVLGSMWCGTLALQRMLQQGHGRVVNTTSGAAVGVSDQVAYSTSKAAILGLTYAWADATRSTPVRVNAVSPRALTRMSRDATDASAAGPEAVAPLVSWLLHSSSEKVHGQVMRSSGNALVLMSPPWPVQPVVTIDGVTPEDVRRTFTADLLGRLQTFGFAEMMAALRRD